MKKFRLIGLILTMCILATGCSWMLAPKEDDGMYEAGDTSTYGAPGGIPLLVKSEKKVFDISDVTLDLYFGLYNKKQSDMHGAENVIDGYGYDKYGQVFFAMYMCKAENDDKLRACAEFEDYMSIEGYELVKEISKEEAAKTEYAYETEGWGQLHIIIVKN